MITVAVASHFNKNTKLEAFAGVGTGGVGWCGNFSYSGMYEKTELFFIKSLYCYSTFF